MFSHNGASGTKSKTLCFVELVKIGVRVRPSFQNVHFITVLLWPRSLTFLSKTRHGSYTPRAKRLCQFLDSEIFYVVLDLSSRINTY